MYKAEFKRNSPITVTILTKNAQETIFETLNSLVLFPEVLIFDTGSQDDTLSIASSFPNVRIISGTFQGFGPTHNQASSLATYDWILSIDSDESLSQELSDEISHLLLDPQCVYQIQRHNLLNNKWIRWCGGWYPDPVIRLYHRQSTSFSQEIVHEKIEPRSLKIYPLTAPLYHTPYRSISDFLKKMELYSTLFAEQYCGKKKSSLLKAMTHGLSAFFKSYFLKKGFLGGKEGWIISAYNGHTTFYKYLKLQEANQRELNNRPLG